MRFTLNIPLNRVSDSVQLDENTVVCTMANDNLFARIIVLGKTDIEFGGHRFFRYSDFPDELKEFIKNHGLWDLSPQVITHSKSHFFLEIFKGVDEHGIKVFSESIPMANRDAMSVKTIMEKIIMKVKP